MDISVPDRNIHVYPYRLGWAPIWSSLMASIHVLTFEYSNHTGIGIHQCNKHTYQLLINWSIMTPVIVTFDINIEDSSDTQGLHMPMCNATALGWLRSGTRG